MTAIDFEKAFDSSNWNFIFRLSKAFGFWVSFLLWIKTFYKNIKSCVGWYNGFFTPFFNLKLGVRQGDLLSSSLFIIALAISIHNNGQIWRPKSISYRHHLVVTNHLTILFINTLELFSTFSGLINQDKTEILLLVNLKVSGLEFGVNNAYNQSSFHKLNVESKLRNLWEHC